MSRYRWLRMGVALVLVGGLAACADANAATQTPSPGCNVYDKLTEKIISMSLEELGGPYPSLGDSATYITYLYDSQGAKLGTVYGMANIPNKLPGGDLMEYSEERIDLPGGVVRTQGLYDITKAIAGQWHFIPAMGESGAFLNKLGRRSFLITKPGVSLDASIQLCPIS